LVNLADLARRNLTLNFRAQIATFEAQKCFKIGKFSGKVMSFSLKMSFFEEKFFGRKSFFKIQVFSSLFPFSKKIVGDFF